MDRVQEKGAGSATVPSVNRGEGVRPHTWPPISTISSKQEMFKNQAKKAALFLFLLRFAFQAFHSEGDLKEIVSCD